MIIILVKHIMRKNVFVFSKNATIKDVIDIMIENNIGSVIILENEKVVGIVTERDLVTKVLTKGLDLNLPVKEIMSSPVITISPNESVEKAAEIMTENKIKKLPVVENDKLLGIITLTDIVASGVKLEEEVLKELSNWFPVRKTGKVAG
ncbi:MAG: CBS domain-containing protein [Candidatus Aenigmatarchaeota archaeon]